MLRHYDNKCYQYNIYYILCNSFQSFKFIYLLVQIFFFHSYIYLFNNIFLSFFFVSERFNYTSHTELLFCYSNTKEQE